MNARNLYLIGFMGVGKSTVGRLCARELGRKLIDSDSVIESRAGCSIPEIFAKRGEAAFRAIEHEVLVDLALEGGYVVATGGGAVMDPENARLMRETGAVVCLTADPEVILKRVGGGAGRPLLASCANRAARIAELLAQRGPVYRTSCHYQIDTGRIRPEQAARRIAAWFRHEEKSNGI